MSSSTIVLCFPAKEQHVSQIKQTAGPQWRVLVSNQDKIGQDVLEADIYCGHAKHKQIDWEDVVSRGKLKWIQSTAAGLDHCLAPAILSSDIVVSGCSGLFASQVAEQTVALLFGLLRSLPCFFRAQQSREYIRRPTDEIRGKTVGIVGFGGNGQQIAKALSPFGAKMIATDCDPEDYRDPGDAAVEVLAADQLLKLLATSDIVIVTLPLTQTTARLFGRNEFRAMKKSAYFINVGRGAVVDHTMLLEALRENRLRAAGLDVCDPEPLPPESPLWQLQNVLITPHVGAQSATRIPLTVRLFCENLARFSDNLPLLNLVDKTLGFPRPENRILWQDLQ